MISATQNEDLPRRIVVQVVVGESQYFPFLGSDRLLKSHK
jgi:hypothetical protein